ncbi:hypothetical protein BDV96DRAFT_595428 [Lophiotrema nucula]|uniref:Uncharacterized protein n=1 Tax=Lophiotrema nucula TaxID=690887 RepID=A0A6A5ZRZ9_9PLEO|nr:hypothetical protein BDV96DRAFT_595428 [Lophiotrema nucula]
MATPSAKKLDDLAGDVLCIVFELVCYLTPKLVSATDEVYCPQLRDPQDLKSLCEVSHHLRKIVAPVLYRSIVLRSVAESQLGNRHTRNFTVEASFHTILALRCLHNYEARIEDSHIAIEDEATASEVLTDPKLKQLHSEFTSVLDNIPEGNVQEFKLNAKRLLELHLDMISWDKAISGLGNDSDKKNLTRTLFRLENGSREMVFSALQCLSLTEMSLKNAATSGARFEYQHAADPEAQIVPWVAGILVHIHFMGTPVLKTLEVQAAYDLVASILARENDHDLSVKSYDSEAVPCVAQFLRCFHGLERLALMTRRVDNPCVIFDGLLSHKDTLEAFVFHTRRFDTEPDSPGLFTTVDDSDFSLGRRFDLLARCASNRSLHPLCTLGRLDFLGVCCYVILLRFFLEPIRTTTNMRILHIRRSGSDRTYEGSIGNQPPAVHYHAASEHESDEASESEEDEDVIYWTLERDVNEFVEWAFGPEGIPSLRIIACGDFSYDGRYEDSRILLCRSETQGEDGMCYRHVQDEDHALNDLVERYSDMLEACPTERRFHD